MTWQGGMRRRRPGGSQGRCPECRPGRPGPVPTTAAHTSRSFSFAFLFLASSLRGREPKGVHSCLPDPPKGRRQAPWETAGGGWPRARAGVPGPPHSRLDHVEGHTEKPPTDPSARGRRPASPKGRREQKPTPGSWGGHGVLRLVHPAGRCAPGRSRKPPHAGQTPDQSRLPHRTEGPIVHALRRPGWLAGPGGSQGPPSPRPASSGPLVPAPIQWALPADLCSPSAGRGGPLGVAAH